MKTFNRTDDTLWVPMALGNPHNLTIGSISTQEWGHHHEVPSSIPINRGKKAVPQKRSKPVVEKLSDLEQVSEPGSSPPKPAHCFGGLGPLCAEHHAEIRKQRKPSRLTSMHLQTYWGKALGIQIDYGNLTF